MEKGVWKVKGIGRGTDEGNCPLCLGNEDAKLALLSCPETEGRGMKFVCKNWLVVE
jgi:hypothetical protein